MQTSIVPDTTEHTTYLLLDEIGHYGSTWREISAEDANVLQSTKVIGAKPTQGENE